MSEINIVDAKINFEGEWLSTDDLSNEIQKKLQAGDLNISDLATALEELSNALENSQIIEARIAVTKEQYEKFKELGGGDDQVCLRKAVMAFIEGGIEAIQIPESEIETMLEDEVEPEPVPAPEPVTEPEPAPEPITEPEPEPEAKVQKLRTIKCAKCQGFIEIDISDMPTEVSCPICGTRGRLKPPKESKVRHQDHFIG